MQDANFPTQFNSGGDFFNNGSTELGMWANSGAKQTVGWGNLTTSGFGGTARSLQVGDQFTITVSATRAFGQIGFSLNAGGSQGSSYANNISGSRLYINTDNYGSWYAGGLSGGATSSFSYTPSQNTRRDYQFRVFITSNTTAYAELWVDGVHQNSANNLTLGGSGGANISALSIYGSDMWDGDSNDDAYWKQTSTVVDTGTVNLGYALTSGQFDPGAVNDGLSANSTTTVRSNAVNIGGNSGSAVILNESNSYTGATTINPNATARAQHANAFGTTAGGVTVSNGGMLELSGNTTIGNEALALNGTGISSAGALRNTSGNNSWSGAVTVSGSSRINSDAGTLAMSGNIGGGSNILYVGGSGNTTLSGVLSGSGASIDSATASLFKDGSGTLILSGTNTQTGATLLNAGTLLIGNNSAFGTGTLQIHWNSTDAKNLASSDSTARTLSNAVNIYNDFTLGQTSGGTGNLTFSGATALGDEAGTRNMTTAAGTSHTFSGIVGGLRGITKLGTGTLILSANNTYTGTTVVNAGTLQLGTGGTSGSLAGAIINNSTFLYSRSDNTTFSNSINGTGAFVKNGSGILTMSGSNKTYTGGTTINAGAIQISSAGVGALGNATDSAVTLNGGALYTNFASNTTPSYAITIGASGGEIRNLNSTGRYLFGSNVLNGSGTLSISFGSGASRVGATATVTTQTGFSGKWIVDGNGGNAGNGFLDVYAEQNFGTGSGDDFLTLQNGAKVLMRGMTFSKGITIGTGGGQIANSGGGNTSISGKISGAAGHDLTFDLGGSATSNITLSNTSNAWSGNTTLSTAGNLRLGASGVLPDAAGNLIFSNASAVLDMNGFNETVGGLSGNGSVDNTAAATTSTLNVGGNNLSTTWSGTLNNTVGTLALVKSGTGALTLSGSNSFSGGTTVTAGTLVLSNANALGSGGVTLNSSNATGSANRSILHLAGVTIAGRTLTMNSTTNRAQLLSSTGSTATWNGTITLEGSTGANGNPELSDTGAGGRLLVQGTIGGSLTGASAGLTLRGVNNSNELAAAVSIGSTDLIKTDGNVWTISSSGNTWGNTTIQMGTLRIGASNALPTSTIVSLGSGTNNGTLDLGSGASSFNQTIGGLTSSSATTASAQKITNSSTGSGTASLTVNTAVSNTFGGVLQDGPTAKVALVKSGTGSLSLGAANTFSGGTTVSAGTLVLTASGALGSGAVILNSSNGTGTANRSILQLAGVNISGGSLTMNSSVNRAQLLSSTASTATWNGTITLEGSVGANGSPELSDSGAGGGLVIQGSVGGSLTGSGAALVLRGASPSSQIDATISIGSTSLQKADSGTWTISGTGHNWGNTTIQSGTLRMGASDALPSSTIVSIGSGSNNGTLDLGAGSSSYSQTIGGLTSSSATTASAQKITNSSTGSGTALLTVNTAVSNSFGGVIQDGPTAKVALVKSGAGTLVLSGSNTYSGSTVVNAGTLSASSAGALSNTANVTVNGGSLLVSADDAINGKNIVLASTANGNGTSASLVFSGTYSGTAGALTLSQDSIIDLGNGSVVVHFTDLIWGLTNTLAIYNWTGTTLWGGGDGNNTDQFYIDRTLTGSELNRISFYSGIDSSSFVGTGYQLSGGSFHREVIPVPEPETWATGLLLLLGSLMSSRLASLRRRRTV